PFVILNILSSNLETNIRAEALAKIKKMNKIILTSIIIFFACNSIFGQSNDDKYKKDVESVDAIINAYYDVVSGSSTDPWEFERDKYIHSKNAVITRLDENGKAESHTLEAEYIPIGLSPKEDFYEKELKRKVSKYGNIAQVWSAFEIRTDPKTESNIKGLNSIQLHYENGRWYIDSWTCEMESEKNNLVTEFLKKQ
ncbi:hypothetical protein, partial [Sediminicola arcticus]